MIAVIGATGFIGSALVLHLVNDLGHEVCTLDAMTYAANPISLAPLADNPRHRLVEADICDRAAVQPAGRADKPFREWHDQQRGSAEAALDADAEEVGIREQAGRGHAPESSI